MRTVHRQQGTFQRTLLCLVLGMSACLSVISQQVIWADEFENGCNSGCYATAYSGVNGAWSVVNVSAAGACANQWFVSCRENGNAANTCGTDCTTNNESLHIANELSGVCGSPFGCIFCPAGDCGAAYDAGCPPALCFACFCSCLSTQTNKRAQSPVIDLTGRTNITLTFKYMEYGDGTNDDFLLEYFNGAAWAALSNPPKTPAGACGGQGQWTQYSIALPASANNNPGVRVGFRWQNNNDAAGNDPSVAIDDVQLTIPYAPDCVGPFVNEVSNGPSGEKEYIEVMVCGPTCSTVDLRNWIIDDNNGVTWNGFSTVMVSGGVSTGHIRFANVAQWSAVPTGSLILVYNNADLNALLPPNDPNDSAPVDSIYVLPANSALLQRCNTSPSATVTGGYFPCSYLAGGAWTNIGFRNEGDAAQTRYPDGRFFHGVSYGPNGQNMNPGGIENMRISTVNHLGRVIFFNTNDSRIAANYTSAVVAGNETPGAVNNAANGLFRATLLCPSTLPIELLDFEVHNDGTAVLLEWSTATERNNDFFTVERSPDLGSWTTVLTTPGAGTSAMVHHYRAHDADPVTGTMYYRLRQTDLDGTSALSKVVSIERRSASNALHATLLENGSVRVEYPCSRAFWQLNDMMGRKLADGITGDGSTAELRIPDGASGVLVLNVLCGAEAVSVRIVK
ncbi:MAG: hypothetical protein IPH60_13625 [Flavobacteriales bacterium]|nr:hypothetical protein [Flavobacteriales bacterium]MBK7102921.1 hypothetical protein [Flavobacteriales bacterium]MBK7113474.1 hypothetical protein [Flavobacteriales bacterium]MBK7482542.1 hypothetical protein [Flavobacteriales bacterium]MBP9176146.1 hypothetical protein [Flavobacteriales bacterium]